MKVLNDKNFFEKDAITLAQNLIGKWIVRNIDGKEIKAQISETEAYLGENDSASHAYKGKTERNKPMWESGGEIYVYLCYGMHYLFNIVSGKEGQAQAVLIRAIVGAQGPGKTTKLLKIDKSFNNQSIIDNSKICIMDDESKYQFASAKRVGINYALAKDREAKLRYVLKIEK